MSQDWILVVWIITKINVIFNKIFLLLLEQKPEVLVTPRLFVSSTVRVCCWLQQLMHHCY